MTANDLDRSPTIAFLIAIAMAVLGYILLSKGALLIGGFACWVSGVNALRAANGWFKGSQAVTEKTLERYAEYCKERDARFPEMVGKWGKP